MNDERPKPVPLQRPEPEIVLPCGVFVKVRRIKWIDLLLAARPNDGLLLPRLAHYIATFDGEQWPQERIQELDVDDFIPLTDMINRQLGEAQKFIGGVK